MSDEEPKDVCGFTLEPIDVTRIDGDAFESDDEWHRAVSCSTCWRVPWSGFDRCIWHADAPEKPAEELATNRTVHPENFDGAILRGAAVPDTLDFSDCTLIGADLTGTDLRGAALVRADLSGARLRNATLSSADLDGARLSNASLQSADLSQATLRYSELPDALLQAADLSAAVLPRAELTGAYAQHADLSDAVLRNADMTDADFEEATLQDTQLTAATLHNAHLERANLTRATLFDADLTGVALHGATLTDIGMNQTTQFGDHYTDDGDIDKAAWTLAQIERLARQNALPNKRQEAFIKRKNARREHARDTGQYRDRVWLTLQRWVAGYGERPWRVVGTSLAVIVICGLLYPLVGGVADAGTVYQIDDIATVVSPAGVAALLRGLYFSVITFTTIGYANVAPLQAGSRLLVGVESFLGAALMALLVAVLARRITR